LANQISRRRFLKLAGGSVLSVGLVGIGSATWVTRIEPYAVEVTYLTIPLPHLDMRFNGTTLVQISDLHLGDWMTLERMQGIIETVNNLQPDVIAVTGDFVSRIWPGTPGEITQILRSLQAREAVVTILGNHDHWTNNRTVSQAILDAGVSLLTNANIALHREDAALYFAGVDDIWERQHDLDAALAGIPTESPIVLLAHEPDYVDEVALSGRVGLQLSGHTHGGQVRVPGRGAMILPTLGEKYDMGLFDVGGMALYVNRGVGMIAPHVRFNCRPEITHITLRTA
jgi:uncharacterized protein